MRTLTSMPTPACWVVFLAQVGLGALLRSLADGDGELDLPETGQGSLRRESWWRTAGDRRTGWPSLDGSV